MDKQTGKHTIEFTEGEYECLRHLFHSCTFEILYDGTLWRMTYEVPRDGYDQIEERWNIGLVKNALKKFDG